MINQSCPVFIPEEAQDSKRQQFRTLSQTVHTGCYQQFRLKSSRSQHQTILTSRVSRFLESLKPDHSTATSYTFKTNQFTIMSNPEAPSTSDLLSFSSAPKLNKECHMLDGILASMTLEIPDTLRIKDFEIRQQLGGLCFAHEHLKFQENIGADFMKRNQTPKAETVIKAINRVNTSGVTPILQTLIANTLHKAKVIRLELREKAVSSIKIHSVKASLKGGSLFSVGLFDPEAVKRAEECQRNIPTTVHVHQGIYTKPTAPRGRTGSLPFRGSSSRGHSSSFQRGRTRGTFQSAFPSNRGRGSNHLQSRSSSSAFKESQRGSCKPTSRGRGAPNTPRK